ncbi:uncharacterized protein LOC131235704 isoform X2 [Magnolia sinica]|uniref:uncharacterized protein LOC131235704 isoform X2 n=1 Tax=Magnolia sinica TaxID=86752 RepID=UPI002657D867|nr:uncharacterized protein LOC131235704 isoform X2 [Magnolia sinica]
MLQADLRSALQFAATVCYVNPILPFGRDPNLRTSSSSKSCHYFLPRAPSIRPISLSRAAVEKKQQEKPSICTADELHYVAVPATEWKLALWRYTPSPNVPPRNHPLLLLSGVGTNAIGFDLAPESSFARYMSSQGFDTWILEVRGAGLSTQEGESKAIEQSTNSYVTSELVKSINKSVTGGAFSSETSTTALSESGNSIVKANKTMTVRDESQLASRLTDTLLRLAERLSGFLSEGLLETRQNSAIAKQIRELSQRLVNSIEEGQRSVSPQFFDLQERLLTTIEDFQKQLDLIVKYDWDFDNYLEEDVPAAMEYIRAQCKPKDGKLLAIGHSMGGILLYAMLSRRGYEGGQSGLGAVVTLGSSLDYTSSKSSLKLLLPLADPAQALNVPVVPLGALLAAVYPLSIRPPYVLSWLNPQISAEDMMHPELFEKLVLNNFCTVPAKLLLQLTTAFRDGGLRDRSGTFCYKDHLHKSSVPVLALAGDQDLICPPEAVYETVKIIPQHLVQYKVFGKPDGPHYGHYDLVGGRLAIDEVYPCIIEFLSHHDEQ